MRISPDTFSRFQKSMVGWYDPAQLIATGAEVLVSTLFARHADSRSVESLHSHAKPIDCSKLGHESGGVWLDYIADTGDGWNSTYAVAEAAAQDLVLKEDGQLVRLRRSQLLIFGGDMVYPTPTVKNYDQRFLAPYLAALTGTDMDTLRVLAIPGNHDWYDSLVGFRRVFCSAERLHPWKCNQRRSYFVVQLPENWWLIGADTQLANDIDEPQLAYFRSAVEGMPDGAGVILCTHEPFWVRGNEEKGTQGQFSRRFLDILVEDVLGPKLRLCIAGDLHHYRRHTSQKGEHRVTCGTGGAFLHPTHGGGAGFVSEDFTLKTSFPTERESRRLALRNLLFPFINPKFGLLTGLAYLLMAWANGIYVGESFGSGEVQIGEIGRMGISDFGQAVKAAVHSAILSPVGSFLYLLVFMGFVFFTDRESRWFRVLGGFGHATAHIIAGFFVYWLAVHLAITDLGLAPKSIPQYLVTGSVIFAGGWLMGSVVMGLYLLVSLNAFGMHSNEAFSSLRLQDWKGFIRMNIAPGGVLRVFFVGIERVPRRWVWRNDEKGPRFKARDPQASVPSIVDSFEISRLNVLSPFENSRTGDLNASRGVTQACPDPK